MSRAISVGFSTIGLMFVCFGGMSKDVPSILCGIGLIAFAIFHAVDDIHETLKNK